MEVWYVIGSIIFGLLVGVSVYFIARRIFYSHSHIIIEQAKAKAKAIEYEAERLLKEHQLKLKEEQLHLERSYDEECAKAKALRSQTELDKLKNENQDIKKEMLCTLSKHLQMSREEATNILLSHLEEELYEEKAMLIRRYEREVQQEAKKKANYILAQATTRYAGDFANERLINVVNLPNDELKGRIIGKEGRNIKTLELISGVDVIIDDTPGSIILSSFNLYRWRKYRA